MSKRLYNLLLAFSFVLMIAALYLIFIYAPAEKEMGDIQRIFYFHVPLAWIAFLAFAVVFVGSILYLWKRESKWDMLAQSSAEIGVVFTTLVLVTGPIWARPVWGTWWEWEPRLTSSLVLWFTYLAYLLVRSYASEESMGARFAAVLGIVGFVNVPIVYLSVNLWRTQHPPHLVNNLDGSMLLTLQVSLAAFTALYVLLMYHSVSIRKLAGRVRYLKRLMEEREG
ncbi:MAG: cytochrome c biogenesis protein CcsA [Dehalococcoidia bacterium]